MEDALNKDSSKTLNSIQSRFHHTSDLMSRDLYIIEKKRITIVYIDGIINTDYLRDSVIEPITNGFKNINEGNHLIQQLTRIVTNPNYKITKSLQEVIDELIYGKAILLVDGYTEALVVDIAEWKERALEESLGERSVRGNVVGLTERAKTNISILRGIIKTENFCIDKQSLGSKSKNDVFILYIDDIVDKQILADIQNKLKKLNIKYLLEARIIQESLASHPKTIFPRTLSTERPDVAASALFEGRVVIIVDGSPQVIIAPSLFMEFLHAPDEYYTSYGRFSGRLIRLLAFLLTILLPGIYLALEGLGQENVPKKVYDILVSEEEILPTVWELVFLLILLRILLDSSFRVPKGAVLLISVLGSVLLGQTAVAAKIIHPVSLLVVGISFIASFTMGNKGLSPTLNVLVTSFIIIGYHFQFMGIIVGLTLLLLYMTNLKSFGVPYLSPLLPFRHREFKDSLYRGDLETLINSEHNYPNHN
ncbi:spore germination protein [Alkalihalobacterium chitinilyticum]|uniref:Spore germination protein n=1 Tax=Alkalihalobacterium chitinilyticum TaxID=2980103 RepID=A0ABT5VCT9_9BACI|nr:spore germination protein [Alkalihalobacterium chitinilyticum]MDE5413255.1 spore germination protein [Alkalihalobacterium chitinilyticum]